MNAREMTDKVKDWQQNAAEACKDWGKTTDQYVHEHTWSSLAMAALLGCVLGYIFASRRD